MLKLARQIGLKMFPVIPSDYIIRYQDFIVWNIVKGLLKIQIQNLGGSTKERDLSVVVCR